MTTTRDAAAFDEIVAAFNDQPGCEMPTLGASGCRRPARWRVNLHGCEQAIMCTQHKNAWLQKVLANADRPRCAHCGKVFDRVHDALTVTAI